MNTNRHSHFFFFNDTATTEIYTLSLHDALPISRAKGKKSAFRDELSHESQPRGLGEKPTLAHETNLETFSLPQPRPRCRANQDRKSTRLNSSHGYISYAVFCLKKKKNKINIIVV